MKKITTILITILCIVSLTSCKNKEFASKEEAKEKLDSILASNFQTESYNYYYSVTTKNCEPSNKEEVLNKSKAKGYVEYIYNSETEEPKLNYTMERSFKLKMVHNSSYESKVSGKEKIVVLDAYNNETIQTYLYQRAKEVRLDSKQQTKINIKTRQSLYTEISEDELFDEVMQLVFDLKSFMERIFKEAQSDGLIYIGKNSCKITMDDADGKIDCELKLDGANIKTVKVTLKAPTYLLNITIDLTKKATIERPKDYKDYIE